MMKETWKDIKGFESVYEVSNHGRVKRVATGRILKNTISGDKRFIVTLYLNGQRKVAHIHKLVAIAFLGHVRCGHEIVVDHIDNDPTNNRVDNLQLISARENTTKDRKSQSGILGVTLTKSNKWQSRISINGKDKNLGTYACPLMASLAYQSKVLTIKSQRR